MKTLFSLLENLIGFRNDDTSPEVGELPEGLTESVSGLTVDQCHDLLTLANLQATRPSNLSAFTDFLEQARQDAVRAFLNQLNLKLVEAGLAPSLVASKPLYPLASNYPTVYHNAGVRGLTIRVLAEDVTVRVERLRLDTTLTAPVVLTLTDEGTGETDTRTLDTVNGWVSLTEPWSLLPNTTYTLTYNTGTSSLNTKPAPAPCKLCKKCLCSYVDVKPTSLDTNYGLNLVMSVRGDVSWRLLDYPEQVVPAYRHQVALTFLEKMAFSSRINGPTEELVQKALYALNDKDNPERVPLRLDKALNTLVSALSREANTVLDIDDSDNVTWGAL